MTVFVPEFEGDKSEDNDHSDLEDKEPEVDAVSETSASKDVIQG